MDETWDSVKMLVPKKNRMREIYAIDYLPSGCIVRKIGVIGYLPERDKDASFIAISQDEYADFVKNTIQLVIKQFVEKNLM